MILILGASSYIGRKIFDVFSPSGVIGTYNSKPTQGCVRFDATFMRLGQALPATSGISHALVVYAETGLDTCKRDVERSNEINVLSTKRVIDDLAAAGIKPIFLSSEYVFDGKKGCYSEQDSPSPTTVYGRQKLEIEKYLAENCIDYVVLRLAKVYGTDPQDGTILSQWLQQVKNGEEIRCADDQFFSPVHVDDVVGLAEAVVRHGLNGVFNTSGPERTGRLEMLETFLDHLGATANVTPCNIKDFNFLDDRPRDLSMTPEKAIREADWNPRTIDSCCEELAAGV